MPDIAKLIASAPMSASLRALALKGSPKRLRRGDLVILEGDFGDTLYIVLSGQLRAYSVGDDDREITYSEHGPGDFVGEMGLDGGPRSAHVEARVAALCIVVTRATLQQHMQADPTFAWELVIHVIGRARQATLILKRIALNRVYGRLKELLESLAVAQPDASRLIDPAPTHKSMSAQLGCGREMVTRVLGELVTGGYLVIGRRQIRLLKKLPAKWAP